MQTQSYQTFLMLVIPASQDQPLVISLYCAGGDGVFEACRSHQTLSLLLILCDDEGECEWGVSVDVFSLRHRRSSRRINLPADKRRYWRCVKPRWCGKSEDQTLFVQSLSHRRRENKNKQPEKHQTCTNHRPVLNWFWSLSAFGFCCRRSCESSDDQCELDWFT